MRDIFQTLGDPALREIEENGTFTIPDMVRLIIKEQKALDHNGRPRKVLTCEPRQHFKIAARNCTAMIPLALRRIRHTVEACLLGRNAWTCRG